MGLKNGRSNTYTTGAYKLGLCTRCSSCWFPCYYERWLWWPYCSMECWGRPTHSKYETVNFFLQNLMLNFFSNSFHFFPPQSSGNQPTNCMMATFHEMVASTNCREWLIMVMRCCSLTGNFFFRISLCCFGWRRQLRLVWHGVRWTLYVSARWAIFRNWFPSPFARH